MKLITAIVQDYDTDRLLRAVSEAGFGVTRIASTGGFLRTGNSTILMGVQDERVAEAIALIGSICHGRVERLAPDLAADLTEWTGMTVADVPMGGAVVFVTNVSQFERL